MGGSRAAVVAFVAVSGCSLGGLGSQYGVDAGTVGRDAGDEVGLDAPSASDGCEAVEDCTNGVDDDCNGLVDCADPACKSAGFACTAADVPSGWSLVAFDATKRPSCPAGYGAERAVVSAPASAPDSCGCTCGGTSAVCGGTASFSGYPNACSTGATSVNVAVNDGACGAVSTSVTAGDSYQLYYASTAVAQQGTCSGTGKITEAPTPTFSAGSTCEGPGKLGAGCSAGACAPGTGGGFATCVVHAGTVACPTFGFTKQVLVSTGNPGYVDLRGCGDCPCATSLSCGTVSSVALFPNGTCAGGASIGIDTGCQLAGASAGIGSYTVAYARSGDASCQPTGASSPTGSVTLDANVETVCCPG